jgi:hypothetical protein
MKSAFAILFSLLLLVTQTAFMTPGACSTVQKVSTQSCCGAHCQKHCCVGKSGVPTAPSVPVAQSVSQIDLQMLPAPQLAPGQSAACSSSLARPDSFVLMVTAIPLYQRNCSYLV